eukprot:5126970-Pyramimonas_sp.AAC.1
MEVLAIVKGGSAQGKHAQERALLDALARILRMSSRGFISQHVPGHSAHPWNERSLRFPCAISLIRPRNGDRHDRRRRSLL